MSKVDKYEYNLKLEEISRLVQSGNYEDAAKIADTVDWRRVRNVRTLCLISEVYEANNRLDDSKVILLRAYKRAQMGREALYRLTEVAIKLEDFDEAVEYYSEYINIAPNDNGKYILKYKLYQGRGSSLEEQIEILEELKEKEYTEKWAYELAMLYKKVGNDKSCIAECDDIVTWFRSGKYVIKALELKQSLTELTPLQQTIYANRDEQIPTKQERVEAVVPELEKVIAQNMSTSEEEALTDNIISQTEKEIAEAVTQHAAEVETLSDIDVPVATGGTIPPTVETKVSYDTKEMQAEIANSMRELVEGMTAKENEEGIIEPMNDKPFVDVLSSSTNQEVDSVTENEEVLPGQMTIDDILTSMATEKSTAEPAEEPLDDPLDEIGEKSVEEALKKGDTIDLSEALEVAAGVADMRPREATVDEPKTLEAEVVKEEILEEMPPLSQDEQHIFSYFTTVAGMRESITSALARLATKLVNDKTSKAGNIIITGETGSGRTTLAIRFAKVISKRKGEAAARIAKLYAEDFNKKDIASAISKIAGGTLIIEEAGDLLPAVAMQLSKAMEFRTDGLVVILEDEKDLLVKLFEAVPEFAEKFTTEVSVPVFTNDELVSFGKTYAYDEDYKIEDMATLALYNRIGEMQTPEHPVNVTDVKAIVDKAIKRSERFGVRKLVMILSRKRYDDDDRIILYEKDFK